VNENYFFYVNYLELFTLVFIRTRSSIKYFAKNITIANMIYLVYVNSHMYAAQREGLLLLISYSVTVLAYFLYNFECEAITKWNPYGTYTPSELSPRCAYQTIECGPSFSTSFDILQMFSVVHF